MPFFFSTIDLAEAYLLVEVAEESRKFLTINTPKGLFQYNRLPFGVKTAPAIFQQLVDTMTAGLSGTAAYLDDIVVTGASIQEHNNRVQELFAKMQTYGLRVRMDKCIFLETEVKFLGQIISKDGRKPDKEKIQAIVQMPAPTDISRLRALLGMITYYSAYVPNMRNIRAPLDNLL